MVLRVFTQIYKRLTAFNFERLHNGVVLKKIFSASLAAKFKCHSNHLLKFLKDYHEYRIYLKENIIYLSFSNFTSSCIFCTLKYCILEESSKAQKNHCEHGVNLARAIQPCRVI